MNLLTKGYQATNMATTQCTSYINTAYITMQTRYRCIWQIKQQRKNMHSCYTTGYMWRFALITELLNEFKLFNFTILGGKVFHTATVWLIKRYLSMSQRAVIDFNLYGLPLVRTTSVLKISLHFKLQSHTSNTILYSITRSATSLLCSRLVVFSNNNLLLYSTQLRPGKCFVNRR